jgi:hypothetical protein
MLLLLTDNSEVADVRRKARRFSWRGEPARPLSLYPRRSSASLVSRIPRGGRTPTDVTCRSTRGGRFCRCSASPAVELNLSAISSSVTRAALQVTTGPRKAASSRRRLKSTRSNVRPLGPNFYALRCDPSALGYSLSSYCTSPEPHVSFPRIQGSTGTIDGMDHFIFAGLPAGSSLGSVTRLLTFPSKGKPSL